MKELFKEKVIFEKTSIWAEGVNDWCHLSAIPQFRWSVVCERLNNSSATSHALVNSNTIGVSSMYNLTELCCLILDILIQMCGFFPSR